MFFLITNITVGKYYHNFLTQFIIGCIFYIATFISFSVKGFVTIATYEKYKYHFLTLIIVDVLYLLYRYNTAHKEMDIHSNGTKSDTKSIRFLSNPDIEESDKSNSIKRNDKTTENSDEVIVGKTTSMSSIDSLSFNSESNDFKVSHNLSSDENDANSLYSTSEEKPEIDLTSL